MTMDELKKYDGRNGAKAYVAYKNNIYDVTESPFWLVPFVSMGMHTNILHTTKTFPHRSIPAYSHNPWCWNISNAQPHPHIHV